MPLSALVPWTEIISPKVTYTSLMKHVHQSQLATVKWSSHIFQSLSPMWHYSCYTRQSWSIDDLETEGTHNLKVPFTTDGEILGSQVLINGIGGTIWQIVMDSQSNDDSCILALLVRLGSYCRDAFNHLFKWISSSCRSLLQWVKQWKWRERIAHLLSRRRRIHCA